VTSALSLQEPEWKPTRKEETEEDGDTSENDLETAMVCAQKLTEPAEEVAEGQKDHREAQNKAERAEHGTTP
jgi:hypothetical protein